MLNRLVEIKIRLNRGMSWFGEFKNALYIVTATKLLFDLDIFIAVIMFPFVMIGFYVVGSLDIFLKFLQTEAELITSKYNPHLNQIGKKGVKA